MAPPGLVLPAVHPPLNTRIYAALCRSGPSPKWPTCVVHARFRRCASQSTPEVRKSMHYAELNKVLSAFHLCLKGRTNKGHVLSLFFVQQSQINTLLLGAIAGLCNCIIESVGLEDLSGARVCMWLCVRGRV